MASPAPLLPPLRVRRGCTGAYGARRGPADSGRGFGRGRATTQGAEQGAHDRHQHGEQGGDHEHGGDRAHEEDAYPRVGDDQRLAQRTFGQRPGKPMMPTSAISFSSNFKLSVTPGSPGPNWRGV